MSKKITSAAYVYECIFKKLKDHIKNSKYYETDNLKTGGPCWHNIAHLNARAHKYTHLRHAKNKSKFDSRLRQNILKFLPNYI